MRIAILDYKDAVPTCVTGPADIWGGLKRMYPLVTGTPLKEDIGIDFITEADGQFTRRPMGSSEAQQLTPRDRYRLIIIPAMRYDKIDEVISREGRLIAWLKQQRHKGADLASICVGAFLLAETGLLDGKKATTNWLFADRFQQRYPAISVQDDKIIVDEGAVYSCGGAFSFTTFMIYLVEKLIGHQEAVMASKILMINTHEDSQLAFSVFRFQHDHVDDPIKKIQQFIEANYQEAIILEKLAGDHHMSVRNFIRRFRQATGNTPLEYLQRVRIEAAKKLLENTRESIENVALQCGYEDISFFRKVFRRQVDMSPKEYHLKYGKLSERQKLKA
ncbi:MULTISPECIES: GlxA family transcriptional regulator [unclassified Chitinophaga]|uniref:GlxA family transcriptional regulator n=1 Tax=unclassified Chitinophaga TaxID=2619133 RepID=UPI00300FE991